MINRIFNKLKRIFKERKLLRMHNRQWATVKNISPIKKFELGNFGGSKLILADLNFDGHEEMIFLQTAGMFRSTLFKENFTSGQFFKKTNEVPFCITATKNTGEIMWQIGKTWSQNTPYLCHGHEEIIKIADVNNDGFLEIITFDNEDNLLIINKEGEIIRKVKLPNDNFSIIYHVPLNGNDFVIVIGTMDRGYDPHPYGNPWLILNSSFEIISLCDYLGAGHNIVVDDVNKDGEPEILIGFQLINLKGEVLWTLDYWRDKEIDSLEQHADCIKGFWENGDWYAAISGSDKQYLINAKGETVWVKELPHPQYCLVGKYKDETRIFVANQREVMNSYSINGQERWRGLLPEYWPHGLKPKFRDPNRPIHLAEPLKLINIKGVDYIIYLEGGLPYVIDFNGKPSLKFDIKLKNEFEKYSSSFARINDIGLSYDVEISANGSLFIYNRWNLFEIEQKKL
jgi:hypothetical protein